MKKYSITYTHADGDDTTCPYAWLPAHETSGTTKSRHQRTHQLPTATYGSAPPPARHAPRHHMACRAVLGSQPLWPTALYRAEIFLWGKIGTKIYENCKGPQTSGLKVAARRWGLEEAEQPVQWLFSLQFGNHKSATLQLWIRMGGDGWMVELWSRDPRMTWLHEIA